ncbi:MarR family winged helix-turn-helix transcriptional regulator [Catenulispora pinisilvae]|uniref:MarR family winged helix-turn-helix transcriptional regulator n=1 Tax=Catenulispora pinisilvae TaxID=2705253 RepID=UPI00189105C4|nr:MarR family transcriptional regulator [Catenulispora pinisilvae]
MARRAADQQDYVDRLIEAMTGTYEPEVAEAKALAYRLRRLAHRMETDIKRELSPHGIELWELELLACLIRSRPGHQLSAGQLMAQLQLTSGAITNRVARLEGNGWLTREIDPNDRRSVLVTLTPAGMERAFEVFAIKTDAEFSLLSPIPLTAQRRINDDLRTVLIALEGQA